MHNIGIIAGNTNAHPVGEQQYGSSFASGNWVCPAGVTKVNVVLVGMGGDGVQFGGGRSGGGGGALVYKNSITVVPGTNYPYTINASYTGIFGLRANAGAAGTSTTNPSLGGTATSNGSPDAGFNGGNAMTGSGGGVAAGGGAASYTAHGLTGGNAGIGLTGIGSTGDFGRGGNSPYSGPAQTGGQGAIRIIWGTGRSFPSNAT